MAQTVFEFEVSFNHKIKTKTFTRWVQFEHEAIDQARDGFQAAYGYWPGEATVVRTGRELKK